MFIYFTNICFTLISFHFIYGFNLSCITIKLKRDERYRVEKQAATQRPLAKARAWKKPKKKQASFSKSEETDNTTVTEIITSEDDNPSRFIRNLTCSPTIETKRDVYMFSSLPVVESISEENDEGSSSAQPFSGNSSSPFYLK